MRPALLTLLLFVLPIHAQDPDPTAPPGTTTEAKATKLVVVEETTAAVEYTLANVQRGGVVEWTITPRYAGDYLRQFKGSSRLIYAGPPGKYVAVARVVYTRWLVDGPLEVKKGEVAPVSLEAFELRREFVLGVGPGPEPPGPTPPGPTPPGPTPVDPLITSLRTAAAQDGWTAGKLVALSKAFQDAANATVAGKTAAQGEQARGRALKAALPEGVPPTVRAVCAAVQSEVNAFLPASAPEHVVTAAEANQVKAIYARLAAACEGAAR